MHQSIVQTRGRVSFPAFTAERVYMRKFLPKEGLPADLKRWQPTVDAMLQGVDAPGCVFIMIDQKDVAQGKSHRRPGVHLDGYWLEASQSHGGGGGHGGNPTVGEWETDKWKTCDFSSKEALLLASDISACRAFVGDWDGAIGEGGDCSTVDTSRMKSVTLAADRVYAVNVSNLHESLIIPRKTRRTLVRINVPGWSPELLT